MEMLKVRLCYVSGDLISELSASTADVVVFPGTDCCEAGRMKCQAGDGHFAKKCFRKIKLGA